MIPESHLRALEQRLERDHVVRFDNDSQVEYEDCPRCKGHGRLLDPAYPGQPREAITETKPCPRCKGRKVRLLVTRPAGGKARYRLDTEIRRAYDMALHGPPRRPQPPSRDYGDCPF